MITATCGPANEGIALCAPECRDFCMDRSALPGGANERLHVIEVPLERASAGGGELVLRPGHAALERLGARDVLRVLELARVHAQVPVRRVHHALEIIERDGGAHRARADDGEPQAPVAHSLERGCALLDARARLGRPAPPRAPAARRPPPTA